MNIKKMFTVLSGVIVAATMVMPSASVLGASYSQELRDAYNWAHDKGITTMSTIDNANMYGAITRAEMAKMLAVYATEVLGMTPDTSAACRFTDTDSVKGDLKDYITESCQLGIMGQGISAFRPYDTISRAEFGTALSRVLWGNKYEGGNPYYANHLNALKAAGIMNQIANAESTKEVRGYVMLMLMRSEGNDAVVDCDDADVKLACFDEDSDMYKNCPAACRKDNSKEDDSSTVVKAGSLAVTATPATDRKAIINAVSDLDTLKFRTSEEVTISKVVLERYGYSKGGDVEAVWLEDENGNEITSRKSVNSRDQVELSFKRDYKVVDGTVNATIVVELEDTVTTGGTIGFKVVSAVSTAENQELDKSGYTPYTYDMVGYDAVTVSLDARGNSKDYNYEEGEMYEVAKFKLRAGTSPLLVNGVTLTNEYAGDILDLKDFVDKVEVLVNGEKVDGVNFNINKKTELVVSFDSVEVAAKENATFTVNIALDGFDQYGQGVQFIVKNESDVKIQEKKTGARVSVELPWEEDGNTDIDDVWASHKFVGSKIKLSNTKLGNVEYAAGSTDVVVAEGTITLAEAVELKDNKFTVTAVNGGDVIEEMRLYVGQNEIGEFVKDGNKFKLQDAIIEEGGKFQIKVDLDRDAEEGVIVTFGPDFDEEAFSGATYTDADDSKVNPDEISGTIGFASRLTVQASKASLTNDMKDGAEFKDKQASEEVEVLNGKYTAKKGDVILSEFAVKAASESLDLENSKVTFYLYIDGSKTSVADIRLGGTSLSGSESFRNVRVDAGESVDVRVTAEVNAKSLIAAGETEKELGKFEITLSGEDDEGNTAGTASRKTVDLTVVKAGSIIVDETSKDKTILLAKNQTELANLNVKPDGSATELETLVFTVEGAGATGWTNNTLDESLKVEIDGTDVVEDGYCSVATDSTKATVTCVDMSEKVNTKANIAISLEDEDDAAGDVILTITTINGDENVNKEFNKKFVNALVTVSKQEFTRLDTTFTIKVDKKSSSDSASALSIWAKVEGTCTEVYSGTTTINNNSTVEFVNGTEAKEICKVVYEDDEIGTITIPKETYPDYFKNIPTVGGEKSSMALMINDNAK